MSDNSPPPDNSAYIAQQQHDDAIKAKADADAKAVSDAAALNQLRGTTRDAATGNVRQFFTSRGLDPNAYVSDIDSQLNNISNSINPNDPNPGGSYTTAGQDIYNAATASNEAKANASLNQIFNPTYSTDKINQSLTDPITNALFNTQRASADDVVKNMIKRGVLTASGGTAAEADLDRQSAGVRSKLQGFGADAVAGGQQSLDDIINGAHQTASNLQLGQSFDPSSYTGKASDAFDRFVSGLGDNINAKVGNGNLFQTNGLAAIGGTAQGAGNNKYDPLAAAGIINDDTQPKAPTSSSENVF